ncbi:hypothetical protein ACWELB_20830 [Streptomyces asiaticus]
MAERDDLRARLVEALDNAHKTQPCTCGSTIWSTCFHQGALSNDERRAAAVLEAVDSYIDEQTRKTVDMAALLQDAERIPALTAKVERAEEQVEKARRIAVELENENARLTARIAELEANAWTPDIQDRYRKRALQWGAAEVLVERARDKDIDQIETDVIADALGLNEEDA